MNRLTCVHTHTSTNTHTHTEAWKRIALRVQHFTGVLHGEQGRRDIIPLVHVCVCVCVCVCVSLTLYGWLLAGTSCTVAVGAGERVLAVAVN